MDPSGHSPISLAGAVAGALANGREDLGVFRPPTPVVAATRGRRRLWQVSPKHHCTLLGAAFDARELRLMFRRAGFADWQTASDYELHSSAVCFAKNRNEFSMLAQRGLEERFASAIAQFNAARTCDVLGLWRTLAAQGEAVGAYWAALTHPALDAEADELLSREMHMRAHAEFAARRAMRRRVRALEQQIADFATTHATLRERTDSLAQENRELRAALDGARLEALQAGAELDRWRSGEAAGALKARQAELERALEVSREQHDTAQRALREAKRRLERLETSSGPAEKPLAYPRAPDSHTSMTQPASPPDLAGRRLLCIGGKRAVVAQYRAIVERAGAEFAYHDGGVEDRLGRLPAMLAAADAVVCLAGDCSHAAYRLAKRYCKTKRKACALIGNSSVTALARCLGEHFSPLR